MKIPVMSGLIDRRILVNFRVEPSILKGLLPEPFRPKVVHGHGMAGVCLIRLKQLRPRFVPGGLGISSENAAHRIAVEWEQGGEHREGVYIPRRDTSSRLNTLAGGRLFPGVHHHGRFQVEEDSDHYSVVLDSDDGKVHIAIAGRLALKLPETSIFSSVEEASEFFRRGSFGYSLSDASGVYDGLELRTFDWDVKPLEVEQVESSYFEDEKSFPPDSIAFDSALLMRNLRHEWHEQPLLDASKLPCRATRVPAAAAVAT